MTSLKRIANTLRPLSPVLSALKYVAAVHLILEWVVSFNITSGPSMLPTIALERDWVCISKLHARGRGVEVGDLISFKSPIEPGANSLKRVLGMPGDFVERDTPSTNGEGRLLRVSYSFQPPKTHSRRVDDLIIGP